jgi:hypothetical protein
MCDQGLVHHCRLFGKACEKPSPKSKLILNSLDGIVFALKEFSCLLIADGGALACAAAGNLGLDRQPHSRLPGSMRERMIQKQLPAFGQDHARTQRDRFLARLRPRYDFR